MTKLIYFLELTVIPEKYVQFEEYFPKFWKPHFYHEKGKGKDMKMYKSFVGANGIEVIIQVAIDSFKNMDLFKHTPEMVTEYYGRDKALEIMNKYSECLCGQKSRILEYYDMTV